MESEVRMSVDRVVRNGLRGSVCLLVAIGLGACSSATVVRTSGAPGSKPGAAAPRPSVPKPGVSATVRRGDTLYAIARANSIAPQDLAAWNRLPPPYTIYPGQSLKLYPPGGGSGSGTVVARPGSAPVAPPSSAGTAARPPVAVPTPVSSGFSWRWPADGAVVSRFVVGETTRQGVDIAGSSGQAVRAAADGVVVYSGAGLVGYGELIIIKHNEQWLSAYGHNRKRLVNEGQNVKAGEQIAEMGRSGAARDMLHFEIRYNGKPVDPLLYLPSK
ncbi:peptidoglycan DD-metalloendopeptidase family protein [Xanthomonas translucens]|uniref:peptidoglycan DD-metalloendopeptidase family protein n=4 Tax=Xanthomonas campestris pv. translucens TaxID=343 RepID=UPI0005704BE7|nr:peptidoglycan DD-metalloendopeptidase family protein [Xanthomonas translucens]AKK67956.1 membrane protein [Xanthomonas translucens pv. undulosa]MBC3972014.1 peptidoglycan DD-metalloendopeptidase family protein [Xanthomonas translucens pv. undulosa]MCT8269981.1 peptidoglycan DD-metalloendopeptidase family protein [Xanthomonas translucens pv. undulosa]MCT8281090.1 peptidoglycan DD-metalloendopeptidase family protein [Xanthomonas translucens pv. undulosa]MCT8315902.1 peptidoglycan DD-metalloen